MAFVAEQRLIYYHITMEQHESRPDRPEDYFTLEERIQDLRAALAQTKETRQNILRELAEVQEMFVVIDEKVKQRTAAGTLTKSLLQLLELAGKTVNDLARMVLQANEFEEKIKQTSETLSARAEQAKTQLLNIKPEQLN